MASWAALLAEQGQLLPAVDILLVVVQQPVTAANVKSEAERLLAQLAGRLPPEQMASGAPA